LGSLIPENLKFAPQRKSSSASSSLVLRTLGSNFSPLPPRFVKHLRTHNIDYDDKTHGYREAENIKLLVEECLKNANLKDDRVAAASNSGVRIVETAIRQLDAGDNQSIAAEHHSNLPIELRAEEMGGYETTQQPQGSLLCQKRPYFVQYRPSTDNHPYQI
jgi:hypothetical protein